MPLPAFDLRLTGYVGQPAFSRETVDAALARGAGRPVSVLIESYGGSLACGLSIASALKAHGDVTVYFRGMVASAATIASLGARKIVIDSNAMYLAHKVSVEFFEWAQMNSDDMEKLIQELRKTRADLDTFDRNVALMYATKCRKSADELLRLMGRESWLTAQEALEWGLVDEIHEVVGSPRLTDAAAAAMAAAGTPVPPLPVAADTRGIAGRILRFIDSLFRTADTDNHAEAAGSGDKNPDEMNQTAEPQAAATEPQATAAPEPAEPQAAAPEPQAAAPAPDADALAELEALRAENARLRAAMSHSPAAGTTRVVAAAAAPRSFADAYASSVRESRSLMDQLNRIF